MEVQVGPSDQWNYTQEMAMYEDILDAVYVEWTTGSPYVPKILSMHIKRKWIEWAWNIGDPTVWEYAEKDSFPGTVTYHDSIHSPKDFPLPDFTTKKHRICQSEKRSLSVNL